MEKVYKVQLMVEVVVSAKNEQEAEEQAIEYGKLSEATRGDITRVLNQDDMPMFYSVKDGPANGIGYSVQDILDDLH